MPDPIISKACSSCGIKKTFGEFGVRKSTTDGLRSACKSCEIAASAAYRLAHPEKIVSGRAAYYAEKALEMQPSTNSGAKAFIKRHYAELLAWVNKNHPGCQTKKPKAAKKSVVGKLNSAIQSADSEIKNKKQRDDPKRAASSFIQNSKIDPTSDEFLSSFEWRATRMMALKKHGATCQCCGASAKTGAVIHVDHIKPRKKFPSLALDVENLQVLCHECNHGKGNWDQTDWRNTP